MLSLRAKLTVAMIAMSFVGIAVVGLTARWITLALFDDLVVDRAAQGFLTEVTDYYEAYGSWGAAVQAEAFTDFVARTRPGALRPPRGVDGEEGPPPPPSGDRRPLPRRDFEYGGQPPPFVVTDRAGRVLVPLAGYEVGRSVPAADLERGRPILSAGDEVGLAVPLERPSLTDLEERYVSAIQEAWLYAFLLAIALAVPVGIALGNRFATPVQELTQAIRAMQRGQIRQSVRVRSYDELGSLAVAFNQMSDELATTYQKLEESREQLSAQAAALEELSRRDELTSLLNRRAFNEQAAGMFAQAARFDHAVTLAMADVDHFKRVNDQYSHLIGDAVLREVAQLISSNTREIDLVARYGGEEFAIAFPETPLAGAAALAERLRQLIAEYDWEDFAPGLSVTLSIGLAERAPGQVLLEVLGAADEKLYEAKAQGRNKVCS